MKNGRYRYISAAVAAVILFGVCAYATGLFEQETVSDVMGKLSDCFSVAGAVIAGIGALSWANSKGAYDMLAFGIDALIKPFTSRRRDFETFYEFKLRKAESRRPWQKQWFFVGLALLGASVVCLVLYFAL